MSNKKISKWLLFLCKVMAWLNKLLGKAIDNQKTYPDAICEYRIVREAERTYSKITLLEDALNKRKEVIKLLKK